MLLLPIASTPCAPGVFAEKVPHRPMGEGSLYLRAERTPRLCLRRRATCRACRLRFARSRGRAPLPAQPASFHTPFTAATATNTTPPPTPPCPIRRVRARNAATRSAATLPSSTRPSWKFSLTQRPGWRSRCVLQSHKRRRCSCLAMRRACRGLCERHRRSGRAARGRATNSVLTGLRRAAELRRGSLRLAVAVVLRMKASGAASGQPPSASL